MQETQGTNFELMEKMPVSRAILTLSIPTLITTVISLIYNLTDTYFIGLLDDPIQLGAISLAYPVFMIIQAVGNIFGNGAPSYISRSLGAKNYDEVKRTSTVSAYMATISTIVLTIGYFLFKTPILNMLGTSPDTIGPVKGYLDVIISCSFVMTLQIVLPAFLRAEGKTKQSAIGSGIGIVLNIILDPIFILGFHKGVAGAAWATIISNAVAVVYYLFIYFKTDTCLSVLPRNFKPSKRIFSQVLKIGFPSSISSLLMSVASILMQNRAAAYGDYVISGYGVATKMISIVFMLVLGYASGYLPFAGYNYGAKNYKRMLSALKFTVVSSTCACVIALIPFVFLSCAFMGAFTTETEVIDAGVKFLRAYAICLPFLGIQVSFMNTFQATGSAIKAMVVSLGRQCIFHMPFIVLFNHLWQFTGLTFAGPTADILTAIAATLLVIPLLRKLIKYEKETALEEA